MVFKPQRDFAMHMLCLDLEGVLVPEIWIAFSEVTGIPEFHRTTRDEPDYDKLMRFRLDLLAKHHLKLADIQRDIGQVVILSDTFTQFAGPLMAKLGRPTLLCNELTVAPDGAIAGYTMRQHAGKLHAIEAFRTLNIRTMAAGDSFNDLKMITAADTGALFRTTPAIRAQFPTVPP